MIPFHELGEKAHKVNKANGWEIFTPDDWTNVLKLCAHTALIHTEITEAAEALEDNDLTNLREELADVAIRVSSIAHGIGAKLQHNFAHPSPEFTEVPTTELDISKGIMQLHKATSHATEAVRKQDSAEFIIQLIIILLHTAALSKAIGSDLAAEMDKKIEKNASRGHKHGGKAI
jgi:NTP pyrophosphatase (non-canonical NTP hydrolase)